MEKVASNLVLSDAFSGRLVSSASGWILLEVPNALVRGAFSAMEVPGIELPPSKNGRLQAHISVMRAEEVEKVGGTDKITEVGKRFRFRLGPLKECNPLGWDEMDRCWMFTVVSSELSKLRNSYGLPSKPVRGRTELDFHLTVAVRRKGVLRKGDITKKTALVAAFLTHQRPVA